MNGVLTPKNWFATNLVFLCLALVTVAVFSVVGNPPISLAEIIHDAKGISADLFFNARLPRVLLGAIVGACLSSSGVAFQSLLRNPLADPYILGVSGGAALGAVIGLIGNFPFYMITGLSFAFGLVSLFFIYRIARVDGRLPVHTLLLTGVIFNAFAFALIMLINAVVTMAHSHQIIYMLMGSLEARGLEAVFWVLPFMVAGFIILMLNAKRMNLLSLGELSATHLGLDVERYRQLIFVAASLMVGGAVAVSGLIGFVGLFVPHMVRMIVGRDHRLVLPVSFFGGAVFLVICDFAGRTLFSIESFQTQLPVGVVTALVGGPFFVYLLKRARK